MAGESQPPRKLQRNDTRIIGERYPELIPLYEDIYVKGRRTYWGELDSELRRYAKESELLYVRDDDSIWRPFDDLPIIVNYFYHEEVKKSAKKSGDNQSSSLTEKDLKRFNALF